MVLFSLRNGPFCKPKWCFLQCGEIDLKIKLLIFSVLWKALIISVFATEEESGRKYALIFRGISGN